MTQEVKKFVKGNMLKMDRGNLISHGERAEHREGLTAGFTNHDPTPNPYNTCFEKLLDRAIYPRHLHSLSKFLKKGNISKINMFFTEI